MYMPVQKDCLSISIQGIVQGVGFRPFIYNLAREMHIRGTVSNTSEGVVITAEGDDLAGFIERIQREAPPLARIVSIDIAPAKACSFADFSIAASSDAGSFTLLSPDIAVCDECLKELFDPRNRRYLYPFINCTSCGPRYSITRSVPYDRKNTTMQVFTMCPQCLSEYHDPHDRRFHAQPNACSQCGPAVSLLGREGRIMAAGDPIAEAIALLQQGKIIAIKGLGGFHLACDAMNAGAVSTLRTGKRKSNKPFALMAADTDVIADYCRISSAEEVLLRSAQRPIVLLRKREHMLFPDAVAPGNAHLGFMLPYTPLHHLLFRRTHGSDGSNLHNSVLVMTSGNISEEPIIHTDEEAVKKLGGIADAFLLHNRDIYMRVDDSVVRVWRLESDCQTRLPVSVLNSAYPTISFVRRARGYVPNPVPLADDGPDVLGCGADMKSTFTLTRGKCAIVSQHIGDMENYETVRFFEETLSNLASAYRAAPVAVAYDLHPGYLSSRWAIAFGKKHGLTMVPVQHHHAHVASVMAEHGLREKVIGVAFDGTGYGDDGAVWGGEFLIADAQGYVRAGHLSPVPLPGSEAAVREPWRVALSYLQEAAGDDLQDCLPATAFLERYGEQKVRDVLVLAGKRAFSPLSTGAGRLFDAVSALLDVCSVNTFEGEAAIALESHVAEGVDGTYPVDIHLRERIITDFSPAVLAIINDMRRGIDRDSIAAMFHNTVASAVVRVVLKLSMMNNSSKIVLCGGVFQNAYLSEKVRIALREEGLDVYEHREIPCNDAGISLGQAFIAREYMRNQRSQ